MIDIEAGSAVWKRRDIFKYHMFMYLKYVSMWTTAQRKRTWKTLHGFVRSGNPNTLSPSSRGAAPKMIGRRIQDENAYFRREYCIQELMWAKNAGKFIQPICRQKDKDRVGEFLELLDTPLKIGGVDTDISHFRSLGQVS